MNMKHLLIALLLSSTATFAQTSVSEYIPGSGQEEGIVYCLPKTALQIDIHIEKVTYTPGEFSKYCERYLGIKGVKHEPYTEWEMKDVTLTPKGTPDKDKTFFIKYKDKTVAPLVTLSKEGIIQAINATPMQKLEPAAPVTSPEKRVNVQQYMTQEILMANSTAKKAELIAQEIYNIRESRNLFLRGEADNMPGDNESLTIILSKLDEQEKALTRLFTGDREVESKTFSFNVIPAKDIDGMPVVRFSTAFGVVAGDDLSGEPIYLSVKNLDTLPEEEYEGKKKKSKLDGVVYNVPGKAHVTLYTKNGTILERDVMIAQFGTTEMLTGSMFNKNSTVSVVFNDANGGIVKIDRKE